MFVVADRLANSIRACAGKNGRTAAAIRRTAGSIPQVVPPFVEQLERTLPLDLQHHPVGMVGRQLVAAGGRFEPFDYLVEDLIPLTGSQLGRVSQVAAPQLGDGTDDHLTQIGESVHVSPVDQPRRARCT